MLSHLCRLFLSPRQPRRGLCGAFARPESGPMQAPIGRAKHQIPTQHADCLRVAERNVDEQILYIYTQAGGNRNPCMQTKTGLNWTY